MPFGSPFAKFRPSRQNSHQGSLGFTLAELLIALVILGEIATFTIPKILTGQATSRNNAIAKEALASLSGAYQQYQMNMGTVPTSTTPGALTQYMNYVSITNTGTVDLDPYDASVMGATTFSCTASYPCMKLHNGAIIMFVNGGTFATTSGVVDVLVDPDGSVTGKSDSIILYLFYNGRVTTIGSYLGNSSYDPSWLSW